MAKINNRPAWNINIYHNARTLYMHSWHVKQTTKKASLLIDLMVLQQSAALPKSKPADRGLQTSHGTQHYAHTPHKTPERASETVSSQRNFFPLRVSAWGCLFSLPAEREWGGWRWRWRTPETGVGHCQLFATWERCGNWDAADLRTCIVLAVQGLFG